MNGGEQQISESVRSERIWMKDGNWMSTLKYSMQSKVVMRSNTFYCPDM